jgi:urease accessory protein
MLKRSQLLLLTLTLLSGAAEAHTSEASGIVSGLLHPVMGADHLVAMVAVGIIGAIAGGKAVWMLPVYFPVVMAVGGVLGIKGVTLPYVESLIALSGIVFGLVILAWRRMPLTAAAVLVAFFALFHGYAHGTELPASASPVEYCVGFVLGTGLLHAAGIGLSRLESLAQGKRLLRTIGAAISLTGCYYLIG